MPSNSPGDNDRRNVSYPTTNGAARQTPSIVGRYRHEGGVIVLQAAGERNGSPPAGSAA